MSKLAVSVEQFHKDVKNHSLRIIHDDGVSRHISFSDNGSFNYKFELITWPGYLCIAGDCGTYVFKRLNDMFQFFRSNTESDQEAEKTLRINPSYWGEKLDSVCRSGGYKEFSEDLFKEQVKKQFDAFWEDANSEPLKMECWQEIEESVLCFSDYESEAYTAVRDFSFETDESMNDFCFQDMFVEGSYQEYTIHYIWCLYAIAYGISEYDKHQASSQIHTKGN